jgi:hypothetical protein
MDFVDYGFLTQISTTLQFYWWGKTENSEKYADICKYDN